MSPSAEAAAIYADVLIIGAGPAGSATAIHLGQLGVGNVVLVDRQNFPRDKTCGSGVSPKGIEILKALGVWDAVTPEAYSIKGLRLVTRGNAEAYICAADDAVAIICQRRILDNCLLERARTLGVRFIPAFEARTLIYDGARATGVEARDGRTVRAKYTVVADGAHSRFTLNPKSKRTLQGIMGWWENVPFKPNHVEMIFDETLAPHYGWLFPETASRVNIGICYEDMSHRKNANALFDRFLQKHYGTRLTEAVQLNHWKGYPISYSYQVGKLQSPGRLVVGEAGRMTHPATAEGIYQGMRSGMLAAEALRDVLSNSADEAATWLAYEARCRRAFRASFWSAKIWRGAVKSPMLDWVVGFGQRPGVKRALARLMTQM
jgi:geranylgeranyl reductase family protein